MHDRAAPSRPYQPLPDLLAGPSVERSPYPHASHRESPFDDVPEDQDDPDETAHSQSILNFGAAAIVLMLTVAGALCLAWTVFRVVIWATW